MIERAGLGEEGIAALVGDLEPAFADVVASPLDQQRREFFGHDALQERNVLADELFLQADRMRGDDDAALGGGTGGLDGGDEVREALADAGAGLDEEVAFPVDGGGDGLGHVELLGAGFEPGIVPGHQPARAED